MHDVAEFVEERIHLVERKVRDLPSLRRLEVHHQDRERNLISAGHPARRAEAEAGGVTKLSFAGKEIDMELAQQAPAGHVVAAADKEGRIHLWSLREDRPSVQIQAARLMIHNLTFSPDSRRLAAERLELAGQFLRSSDAVVNGDDMLRAVEYDRGRDG